MKIAIFGATGGTGRELVRQALERGHAVTAFVRDPARMAGGGEGLAVMVGDVRDAAAVARCVQGQDAVLCALGARDLRRTTVRATGTAHIIEGMKASGVQRLVVVSAMGVGASWDALSPVNKAFFATLLSSARADHEAQEAAVMNSGLDWTIVRPSGLVDTPGTGVYRVGESVRARTSRIPRADVAAMILDELAAGRLVGKAVTITN